MSQVLEIETTDQLLRRVPLEGSVMVVGRDQRCEVPINAPSISRQHARLTSENGYWAIEDLGSRNGTFVNGARLSASQVLRDGDSVRFGSIAARYLAKGQRPGNASASGVGNVVTQLRGSGRLEWRAQMLLTLLSATMVFLLVTVASFWWVARDDWMVPARATLGAFAADNRHALESRGAGAEIPPSGAQVAGDGRIQDPVVLSPEGEVLWPASQAGESWRYLADIPASTSPERFQILRPAESDASRSVLVMRVESHGLVLGWVGGEWRRGGADPGRVVPLLAWLIFTWVLLAYLSHRSATRLVTMPVMGMAKQVQDSGAKRLDALAAPVNMPEMHSFVELVRSCTTADSSGVATETGARQADLERWFGGLPLPTIITDQNFGVVAVNRPARNLLGHAGVLTGDIALHDILPKDPAGATVLRALEGLDPGENAQITLAGSSVLDGVDARVARALLATDYAYAVMFVTEHAAMRA